MDIHSPCSPGELGQVMDQYGPMVYRLAYSQLRSSSDAEDISQEVFLRYYQKRPQFQSEEHRRAWLLRVTLNRVRSYLSSAWIRHIVPMEEVRVTFQEPEEQRLNDALAQLSSKDRTLLHLYYYEDLSTREMAQLLSRKESTIRTQLARARSRLATILKGEGYEETLPQHL